MAKKTNKKTKKQFDSGYTRQVLWRVHFTHEGKDAQPLHISGETFKEALAKFDKWNDMHYEVHAFQRIGDIVEWTEWEVTK